MMGQIATIMENLHLSYKEVVDEIPYRTLMMMQADKVRILTGTIVKKMSGKDFASRRINKQKTE